MTFFLGVVIGLWVGALLGLLIAGLLQDLDHTVPPPDDAKAQRMLAALMADGWEPHTPRPDEGWDDWMQARDCIGAEGAEPAEVVIRRLRGGDR